MKPVDPYSIVRMRTMRRPALQNAQQSPLLDANHVRALLTAPLSHPLGSAAGGAHLSDALQYFLHEKSTAGKPLALAKRIRLEQLFTLPEFQLAIGGYLTATALYLPLASAAHRKMGLDAPGRDVHLADEATNAALQKVRTAFNPWAKLLADKADAIDLPRGDMLMLTLLVEGCVCDFAERQRTHEWWRKATPVSRFFESREQGNGRNPGVR